MIYLMQQNLQLSGTPSFPAVQGVTRIHMDLPKYYAHEIGTNEVDAAGATTAITSYI
jgi:hypothetical protein